jgi:hypothetical protein
MQDRSHKPVTLEKPLWVTKPSNTKNSRASQNLKPELPPMECGKILGIGHFWMETI